MADEKQPEATAVDMGLGALGDFLKKKFVPAPVGAAIDALSTGADKVLPKGASGASEALTGAAGKAGEALDTLKKDGAAKMEEVKGAAAALVAPASKAVPDAAPAVGALPAAANAEPTPAVKAAIKVVTDALGTSTPPVAASAAIAPKQPAVKGRFSESDPSIYARALDAIKAKDGIEDKPRKYEALGELAAQATHHAKPAGKGGHAK